MIFSCDSGLLASALSIVSHCLPVRSPKPILEGILVETCEEGIRLTCTDLSLGMETIVEATVSEEGRVVLPGKLFAEAVRKFPGGDCTFTVNDRLMATISCDAFRMSMSGMEAIEYPELPEVTGPSFAMEQGALRTMISQVLFATATDESRPILTGALMEMHPDSFVMVALDGFRLALRRIPVRGPEKEVSCVLGGKVLGDVAKILSDTEDEVSMICGTSHVQMTLGATRVIARRLEGEFIRYHQILPTEWKTMTIVDRQPLERAIDRASLIAREGKSNLVAFQIEEDTLKVSSNSEISDMEERIPAETQGSDLAISFNVRYVTDVLKVIGEDRVVMRFNSNVSPCVIVPERGDEYLYLLLPVRVFNAR